METSDRKKYGTVLRAGMTFGELEAGEGAEAAAACRKWLEDHNEGLLMIWGKDSKYLLKIKYAIENWMIDRGAEFLSYSVETWTEKLIGALHEHQKEWFVAEMTELESLMIDHIDCLSGKVHTQTELYEMVRVRSEMGKRTILLAFCGSDSGSNADSFLVGMGTKIENLSKTGTVVYVGEAGIG